nr:hypothetical protein [Propionicimonas sp.]
MEDPKRQAWMYVIVGGIAVIAAIYFLSVDGMGSGSFGIFDWVILGMGIVAVARGVRMFLDLRRGNGTPTRKTITKPGSSRDKDDEKP